MSDDWIDFSTMRLVNETLSVEELKKAYPKATAAEANFKSNVRNWEKDPEHAVKRVRLPEIDRGWRRGKSVQLRDAVYKGFRTVRSSVLAGLNIQNAKVLDLGCNLGEMSRLARKQGAALVDGFEYDSFFVQIGQVIRL